MPSFRDGILSLTSRLEKGRAKIKANKKPSDHHQEGFFM
jgi:hypothetical protein